MAEEVEYDMNNIMLLEDKSIVKEEVEDHKIFVCESGLNISNNESKDYISNTETPQDVITTVENIKTEDGISYVGDLRTECDNGLLSCDQCLGEYEDYCVKCRMLVRILNRNVLSNTDSKAIEDIPKDILEFRDSFGHVGIFALKVIPAGVKFGPFTGLSAVECFCKIKSGRFSVTDDELKFLNWMQYINRARNISEQNLLILQCENEIFYRSIRQIYEGEELLMYFGEEYENSLNEDIEMCFIPPTDDDPGDVFACTFCCLGFNSAMNLAKHKRKVCSKGTDGIFSIEEIMQCPFCKMHMDEREYLEYHKDYCHDRNEREHIMLKLNNKEICANTDGKEGQMYSAVDDMEAPEGRAKVNQHSKDEDKQFKCPECRYRTNHKFCLDRHVKAKHLKEFSYKCDSCEFTTNHKISLTCHVKTRHLKEFDYRCASCSYKSNKKSNLVDHIKTKHLKEFNYACELCKFKTNSKSHLNIHAKTKHLKEFNFKCDVCDFKTFSKSSLDVHVKRKHLEKLSCECDRCQRIPNNKSDPESRAKSKYPTEINYKCDMCKYQSNCGINLKNHIKTKHLKEFKYKCEMCDYKTNDRPNLNRHVKAKHLKKLDHKCETCEFETNQKANLERHMKAIHLKEVKCEICGFVTMDETHYRMHMKIRHL